jgi:large subunit ribosomal protein L22
MEAIAKVNHLRQSPFKMRQVVDIVRGKNVDEALKVLAFTNRKAAIIISKAVNSAVANLSNNDGEYDADKLYIKTATVDGGPMMKRWKPAAMGRATPILKRSSHLTIVVSDEKKTR